jgi:imidazolonepropionase-like amidohydrolase
MNIGSSFATLAALALGFPGDGTKSAFEHPSELDADRATSLDARGGALIRNVTIHSAVDPAHVGDVLVRAGKIAAIGTDLEASEGVLVVDGTGKHLAPGVIDTHSHMAIDRGINEGTLSITAECDITDVIEPDDVSIYRALAGGVTTIQCLHGSANAIGGRSEVLKLRWKRRADELRFPDAPQGIKFALGENPKRSNYGPGERYPATRPGVESVFNRAFRRALEYRAEWATYQEARARGEDLLAPRKDVRLEVLSGILEGTVKVHSHCYRADEILMLLRMAEGFGFRVQTLQPPRCITWPCATNSCPG